VDAMVLDTAVDAIVADAVVKMMVSVVRWVFVAQIKAVVSNIDPDLGALMWIQQWKQWCRCNLYVLQSELRKTFLSGDFIVDGYRKTVASTVDSDDRCTEPMAPTSRRRDATGRRDGYKSDAWLSTVQQFFRFSTFNQHSPAWHSE
jgi:hypothetical protein